MVLPVLLGEFAGTLTPYVYRVFMEHGAPAIRSLLTDPSGALARVGDLLVWQGSLGQRIVGGFQPLFDSQPRIERSVTQRSGVSLATQTSLDVVWKFSLTTLGVASLSGALMLWRLNALDTHFRSLLQIARDVEDNLDAQNRAHLRVAVQRLREFDDNAPEHSHLTAVRDEALYAVNVYGDLAHKEAAAPQPRMPPRNYRSRCYCLALLPGGP